MTDPTGYQQNPMNYQTAYTGPQRPTAVTVAAVIGIVLASLSLICNGLGILGALFQGLFQGLAGQAQQMEMPKSVTIASVAIALVGFILAIAWLAISIGLLKLAPWSRGAALKLAMVHIVFCIVALVVNVTVVAPETKKATEQALAQQQTSPSAPKLGSGFAAGAAYGGAAVAVVWGLIIPATMLIALRGASARVAFESQPPM